MTAKAKTAAPKIDTKQIEEAVAVHPDLNQQHHEHDDANKRADEAKREEGRAHGLAQRQPRVERQLTIDGALIHSRHYS